MKRKLAIVAASAMAVLAGPGVALGQDDAMDEPQYRPVETFTCSYVDGKGRADLDKVIAAWNKWMDGQGVGNYFAALATPYYYGEWAFDIGWLGVWKDGNAMGQGTDTWLAKGSEVNNKFSEVVTCDSHSGYVSLMVEQPAQNDEPDGDFVLTFQNCSMKEGKEFDEYLAAQETWNAYADEHGIEGGTWVWFPLWGESDDDYDFKLIYGEDDFTEVGANWAKFAEGHYRKSEELFADLLDCDVGRVYLGEMVRDWADDE